MKQYDEIVFSADVRDYYERFQKIKRDINYIKNVLDIGLIPSSEQLFVDINRKLFQQFKEISDNSDVVLNWLGSYIEEMSMLNEGFVDSIDASENVYLNEAKQLLENNFEEIN